MKVAVLMLSYNRYELLTKTLPHNVKNAGYDFDMFIWDNGSTDPRIKEYLSNTPYPQPVFGVITFSPDNQGIAKPFNCMMNLAFNEQGYDAVVFMANDIKEPKNWLAERVRHLEAIPNSGMISVACGKHDYRPKNVNGLIVYPGHVIGQFMISKQVFDKVGYFREDFGPYGPIDNDYNVRCDQMGFISYYIPGLKANHLDDKDDKKYGYSKSEQVKKTWSQFTQDVNRYADPAACYVPFNGQTTFEMKDYVR